MKTRTIILTYVFLQEGTTKTIAQLRPIITCMDEYDKNITKKQFIKYI